MLFVRSCGISTCSVLSQRNGDALKKCPKCCRKQYYLLDNRFRRNTRQWLGKRLCKLQGMSIQTRLSTRINMCMSDWQKQVLELLKNIEDPDLKQNIVELGFVQNLERVAKEDGKYDVRFTLQLTTPACPIKEKFQNDAKEWVSSLLWVRNVEIDLRANEINRAQAGDRPLNKVKHIIAVASCKGGVGKSTVAVNLAFTLTKLGGKVGIMDADIYGPSLPILVQPENKIVQYKDGRIIPLEYENVKLMSFGYINPESAIMRGPMIANMMNQLLTETDWGSLDYLVIDMPPGTGDIQLTICQTVSLDAAVIVTTPQQLSFQDVIKGIQMFGKVSVPCVALVENMAYFEPNDIPDKRYYLFGHGKSQKIANDYGIPFVESFPLDPDLCRWSDNGIPAVLALSESKISQLYQSLASAVVQQIAKNAFGNGKRIPQVFFDSDKCIIVISCNDQQGIAWNENNKVEWSPWELRNACSCASCVDEFTGKRHWKSVDRNVKPLQIQTAGNYAFSVIWSDGHQSLYPFERVMNPKDWSTTTAVKRASTI
ncbi:ATP-binding protein involved in chromosome partitioning [Galdieria sulphuraria]|uniref:ATP-binding protein involved in chromosome partitioning n=1 Tax=Galdieria sulphuraria TaxID=130081 RepID=M2XX16_GALSU|nr:ATP-binding protein involved in chromosome partitioning [Galdieria sulphuraria]EME27959.1 ATP-binding protein involved in chromosome partitioning [Galdieria sulphuraria]|eukprot:XP_005704479.1 ATP-binding protein involved in chromosome partitioning [Galdieria sulphuraria]